MTVICSDKTGTLSENRMIVERVWTPSGCYDVTGVGYEPAGEITGGPDNPYLERLAMVAAACNDAALHAPGDPHGEWTITGDPTEGALLAFAAKVGVEQADVLRRLPRHAEIAFDASAPTDEHGARRRRVLLDHRQRCLVSLGAAPGR